jgi:hypothetical protein
VPEDRRDRVHRPAPRRGRPKNIRHNNRKR